MDIMLGSTNQDKHDMYNIYTVNTLQIKFCYYVLLFENTPSQC